MRTNFVIFVLATLCFGQEVFAQAAPKEVIVVDGQVAVSNLPASQTVNGTVAISNRPTVDIGNTPTVIVGNSSSQPSSVLVENTSPITVGTSPKLFEYYFFGPCPNVPGFLFCRLPPAAKPADGLIYHIRTINCRTNSFTSPWIGLNLTSGIGLQTGISPELFFPAQTTSRFTHVSENVSVYVNRISPSLETDTSISFTSVKCLIQGELVEPGAVEVIKP